MSCSCPKPDLGTIQNWNQTQWEEKIREKPKNDKWIFLIFVIFNYIHISPMWLHFVNSCSKQIIMQIHSTLPSWLSIFNEWTTWELCYLQPIFISLVLKKLWNKYNKYNCYALAHIYFIAGYPWLENFFYNVYFLPSLFNLENTSFALIFIQYLLW